jgi:hypothetical protein
MAIPYLLIGNVGESGTHLRHAGDHYQRLRIELKRNRAVKVDTAAKTVTMDDGSTHAYDRLLIATGSPGHAADPRHRRAGRARVLDPGRCARDRRPGPAGRPRAADGRRLHRLHHHGGAGQRAASSSASSRWATAWCRA